MVSQLSMDSEALECVGSRGVEGRAGQRGGRSFRDPRCEGASIWQKWGCGRPEVVKDEAGDVIRDQHLRDLMCLTE